MVGSIFNRFSLNEIQKVFRIGSEWFELARIQISKWIGIVLIGSELIPIRYFRQGRLIKNGQKSIRLNPINPETSIRINLNQSETKFSIRINPNHPDLGINRIDSDWKLGFGLVRIHSDCCLWLIRIKTDRFLTVFHYMRYKTFFGLVRNDSHWFRYRYRNGSE